jgi:hypothetical protein
MRFVFGGFALAMAAGGCVAETGAPADDEAFTGSAKQEVSRDDPTRSMPHVIESKESTHSHWLESAPAFPNEVYCWRLGDCEVIPTPIGIVDPPTPPAVPIRPSGP